MFGKINLVLFCGNYDQVIQWFLISIDLPGRFPSVEPLGQVVYLTRKVFLKKHTCGLLFAKLYILIIIINTKLTSYTSH